MCLQALFEFAVHFDGTVLGRGDVIIDAPGKDVLVRRLIRRIQSARGERQAGILGCLVERVVHRVAIRHRVLHRLAAVFIGTRSGFDLACGRVHMLRQLVVLGAFCAR